MKKYRVPALEKAIAILELIAESEERYTITEIHKQLDISKATVFTTLNVLEEHDIVKKDEQGKYGIGVKLYQLGMSYMSNIDMIDTARPFMDDLMQSTGMTVHLGVLDQNEVLYVDKVEPDSFIKFSTFPGMRSDVHINSLGKAICAYLSEAELEQLMTAQGLSRYTPNTITDPQAFKTSLQHIRQSGYAIENEEGEIGVCCIGAPIFDYNGERAIAAVSVAGHSSKLLPELFATIGETVKGTARAISKELGFTGEAFTVQSKENLPSGIS